MKQFRLAVVKVYKRVVLLSLALAFIVGSVVPVDVSAFGGGAGQTWEGRTFTSTNARSFFDNVIHTTYQTFTERYGTRSSVIHGGIPSSARSVNGFVSFLQNTYNNTGTAATTRSSRVGAAFIVYSLLGYNANTANAAGGKHGVPASFFEDLRARLNEATINWNTTVCDGGMTTLSTVSGSSSYDVARDRWTYFNGPSNHCEAGMVITDKTGNQYRIIHTCANPVGATKGLAPATYTLTPQIDTIPTVVEQGQTFAVGGSVTKNGNAASSLATDVRYTRIIHKTSQSTPSNSTGGTSTTVAGCTFYGMTGANASRCTSVTGSTSSAFNNVIFNSGSRAIPPVDDVIPDDFEPGDKVCYGISVSGYDHLTGRTKNGARHSALRCVVIGKKPKVSITGSDLRVGAGSSSNSSVRTSVTKKSEGSDSDAALQGSWGEYGVIASGAVEGMGSASSYAGGRTSGTVSGLPSFCTLSLLTLSNRPATGICTDASMGGYNLPPVVRTVVDYYAAQPKTTTAPAITPSSLTTNGLYTVSGSGVVNIQASTLPAGRSIIIYAPTRDIMISGNQQYAATVSSIREIPQLVIIGRNITIQETVSTVDAWLVARAAGQGNVYTCDIAQTDLRSSNCNTPLTVNGPVIANSLHMRRTAGAGSGADASRTAEKFNLRPDAYMWGLVQTSNGRGVSTSHIKELPPRF